MNILKVMILALLALCSACAVTNGAPYKRDFCGSEGMGNATFYQESGFVGSALHPLLKIDGVEIAPVPKGGFVAVRLASGEHEFELVDNKNDMAAWGKSENSSILFGSSSLVSKLKS